MPAHRYPEDTMATLNDFLESPWKSIVKSLDQESYWQALSKAAGKSKEAGRLAESKVFWLLADASSMMLQPNSVNEPFAPFIQLNDRRSSLPDDFSEGDLSLLAEMLPHIDEPKLKARIADLLWLRKKEDRISYAIIAIDAYREVPIDEENWADGNCDCWERAIALSLQIKKAAGDRINEIEISLFDKYCAIPNGLGFFKLKLAEVLFSHNLAKNKANSIAETLEREAELLSSSKAHFPSREYYKAASQWYGRAGEKEKQADMICAQAETWVQEALSRCSGEQKSNIAASNFLENAIQTYRCVPSKMRTSRKVDEKLIELRQSLSESGKASITEMRVLSSAPIDVTEIVEAAQDSVRNKPLLEALASLANIYRGAKHNQILEFSRRMLQQSPMQALLPHTHMSRDGRVIAQRPGIGLGGEKSEDYKAVLWAEMVRHYNLEIDLIVQAQIWPALQAFSIEHRIRESELIQIATQSSIIPKHRARLVAKALFAGFERDFTISLHLLAPQIENIVRWHLKSVGAKTSTLDANGINNENGLSTLLDQPEVESIFGEDLSFELKALFCDSFGPNLRNEVAHGLVEESTCESASSVYAWWLLLRITFNPFWNAYHKMTIEPPKSDNG